MSEPLDDLLVQLCSGDKAAADHFFRLFEPYLRRVVSRHLTATLRAKFDSMDVVQSVWSDVLRGFREAGWRFVDADHLRGFLFIVTRNRLLDRIQRYERTAAREESLDGVEQRYPLQSLSPRPSEVVQAGELWERIVAQCPAQHHTLLDLKRQGFSLAEIAERTGMHQDSVRRILRTIARQLAFRPTPSPRGDSEGSV